MYVFRPLICGEPPRAVNCETSPGRVRTPPGKKSTSARLGDIPGGTSEGSRSVTQVPKMFSGSGENVSMLMLARARVAEFGYGARSLTVGGDIRRDSRTLRFAGSSLSLTAIS